MRVFQLGAMALVLAIGPMALVACGSEDGKSAGEAQGRVSVALTGVSSSGLTYRLRNGIFNVTGPKAVNFSTETNPDATSLSAELPAGDYLIRLRTGWTMERSNGMTFEPVEAILLSPNPTGFHITDQAHTGVVFLFRAGDDVIQLGNGVLDVSIGIDDGMGCPMESVQCAGVCVNPSSDNQNCGACGNACAAGETCTNGICTGMGCPMGVECAGVCVDLSTDPQNCGACGAVCPAGTACIAGACTGMGCPMPLVQCNGLCVDIQSDPANCGGCGSSCMGNTTCTNGVCALLPCPIGSIQCNGVCINVESDPNNCGFCGNVCSGTGQCVNGACVQACQPGFSDCDGNPMNGCETNTSSNINNCGQCGLICQTPFGTPACVAGICQVGSCQPGRGNCDMIAQNGCETLVDSNPPCQAGVFLGGIAGDAPGPTLGASGQSEQRFRVSVAEAMTGGLGQSLGVRINLNAPAGTFAVEAGCDACSAVSAGGAGTVFLEWNENTDFLGFDTGSFSGRDIFINIVYIGGPACTPPWNLSVIGGDFSSDFPTCSTL